MFQAAGIYLQKFAAKINNQSLGECWLQAVDNFLYETRAKVKLKTVNRILIQWNFDSLYMARDIRIWKI